MKSELSVYKRIDHPIPPLFDRDSRILILGSFPSVKSREAAFFYGHPQNRFWKTMARVLSCPVPGTIDEKKEFLHRNHVAVWDVIKSCDIIGSSDSSIRNVVPNDLTDILDQCDIRQIFCNGAKSHQYYEKYLREQTGIEACRLPSTSPANAAFSLDRLENEWKVICGPLKAAPPGIGRVLLSWFDYNARLLPWRSDPTPYHVWISEIMLQQTRVEAVRGYYDRWMEELPDIRSLSEVSDERLMKLWEGLGYYNRARNLKEAAVAVMDQYQGELPGDYQKLLRLKGIGEYTAGAIASIAFGLPEVAVDGNALRVFARLLGETRDINRQTVKKSLAAEVRRAMPHERYGDYNQALMDLGATVCIPNGKPDCDKCPLENDCLAHRQGRETELPVKQKKQPRKKEQLGVFVILIPGKDSEETRVVLHKRPGKGLLPNLWEFPCVPGDITLKEAEKCAEIWGFSEYVINELGEGKHIFSHVEWQMKGYCLKVDRIPDDVREKQAWEIVTVAQAADRYALPSAFGLYRKQIEKEIRGV